MSIATILKDESSKLGLSLPKEAQQRLGLYLEELERWNQRMNLTALRGAELVRRLVLEPAWIGRELQLSGTLVDVGSGNGCPGISLAVTRGLSAVHLVEARAKRAAFLRHVGVRLGMKTISVHHGRIEDIEGFSGTVDWITLQAVSPTPGILESLRRLTSETTRVVWITGDSSEPPANALRISVPGSSTVAFVFQLHHPSH